MARPVACLVALALLTSVSGCMSGGSGDDDGTPTTTTTSTSTTSDSPTPPVDPCPTATPTSSVADFTVYGGNWSALGEAGSPICGEGDKSVNSLVSTTLGSFANFEAQIMFKMVNRSHIEYDAGAGMVIHFADDKNFQIIRYSPREQGWHLFTMTNGTRIKQDIASVTPPTTNPDFEQWVDLRVRSESGHVTAFDGSVKVIDYVLPVGASTAGNVGYFLRAQQTAHFDGITAVRL